ncbi:hypothetical protein DXD32_09020, partial [Bifidobacterium longum]
SAPSPPDRPTHTKQRKALFILLLYICYFSLSSKNRRFLFIETRTAKLKKNVSLTRRLIGLMQSEEQLV